MKVNWRQFNTNFAKFVWFVLNGFCTLLALGTTVFALVYAHNLKRFGEGSATGNFLVVVIIISGSLYFVGVAAFGIVGVVNRNANVLYMYVTFLMVRAFLQVFITAFVSVQRFGLQVRVSEWLVEDFFRNITQDHKEQHEKLWDRMQVNYECCGLNGPEDYQLLMKPISVSCCPRAFCAKTVHAQQFLYKACIESSGYYTDGCKDELLSALKTDAEWLFAIAVTGFAFETAGMLLAMYLARNAKATTAIYKLQVLI